MELVALLHVLWRFRIAVAVGAVLAIAVGLTVTKDSTSRTGAASMRVILDTPKSLTVDVNPPGMERSRLAIRLLADVMSTRTSRQQIAREIGIPIDASSSLRPTVQPAASFPLPHAALDAAAVASEPYAWR